MAMRLGRENGAFGGNCVALKGNQRGLGSERGRIELDGTNMAAPDHFKSRQGPRLHFPGTQQDKHTQLLNECVHFEGQGIRNQRRGDTG